MTGELLIIGAGPAGLALSHLHDGPSRIVEASDRVGGLCRSIEFAGAVFDIGGHSFHSPHPEVTALVQGLMGENWFSQRRDARVWFDGALMDYPFQQHLDQIADQAIAEECRSGLPKSDVSGAEDFREWIVSRYGSGVAKHFMLPYNEKLWARDLTRMSREWVGERVAPSEKGTAHDGKSRAPLTHDNVVSYPKHGGFGAIYEAMAAKAGPVEFGERIVRIDPRAKTATSGSGKSWNWDTLVSTMALPHLLRAIEGCPADLVADAERLEFVSLKILMLAAKGPVTSEPQRIYVSDPAVPAHKIAFNHTSSPELAARPVQAIMCEIAHSPFKPVAPDDVLERRMKDWLSDAGFVARDGFVEARMIDVPYGYPVYTAARLQIVARIRGYLEGLGIQTLGRFGRWEYVNSDACIWQAYQLAAELRG